MPTPPTTSHPQSGRRPEHDASALRRLERDLRDAVEGDVRFDPASRQMYAHDASHYRQPPVAVVQPRTTDALIAALDVCRAHDAAVLPRGAGTSIAGQAVNHAVILDTSRDLRNIIHLDPDARLARVQPGVILDQLRKQAQVHGLTFGPDPSTHAVCTIGGMIGNNACGVHSLIAGRTSDNVHAMTVRTWDGLTMSLGPNTPAQLSDKAAAGDPESRIHQAIQQLIEQYGDDIRAGFPRIPRRVSGYNLDDLLPERNCNIARALVGSEGTCAVVLEATLRLIESPKARVLVVLGYPDIAAAGDAVPTLLQQNPIGLEGMDHALVDNMKACGLEPAGVRLLPEGRAWLFAEFGGPTQGHALERAAQAVAVIERQHAAPTLHLLEDPAQARAIWSAREAGVGASARLEGVIDTEAGWEDAAVDPERLGDYLRAFRDLLNKHQYRSTQYGHFGQGLVHTRITFDLKSTEGVARYRAFIEEAADLVVSFGGSLSGEHGDGHARAELWPRMFSPRLMQAFRQFKTIWDPHHRMNPGKLIDPLPVDAHLRHGPDYQLPQLATHFAYPDDNASFARATARCIGVGKCLRSDPDEGAGQIMCPSYIATGQEQHSTRGRAHLLNAMAHGQLPDAWRNTQVKDALDLCLSCKACQSDCPAGVDIAAYKAEFLAHYHEHRRRPLRAHLFGRVDRWLRLGAHAPRLCNMLANMPGLSHLLRFMLGISTSRRLPRLSHAPFTRWFHAQPDSTTPEAATVAPARDDRVLLWADTFNNYLAAQTAQAAVRVLAAAGADVTVPRKHLCCGRPLYDFGLLDRAKQQLEQIMQHLGPQLDAGMPIIVLEPSCAAVFRDELLNFFPDDPRARRLAKQTHTLAEYLLHRRDAGRYTPPTRAGRVLLHTHCHQHAVLGDDADVQLLEAAGCAVEKANAGCCGMAGSFGFTARHDQLSRDIAAAALLPRIRDWPSDAPIVTDGFSCREQIAQLTNRRALHLAELLDPARKHRR